MPSIFTVNVDEVISEFRECFQKMENKKNNVYSLYCPKFATNAKIPQIPETESSIHFSIHLLVSLLTHKRTVNCAQRTEVTIRGTSAGKICAEVGKIPAKSGRARASATTSPLDP